jgi:hypothetical protein
MLSIVIPNDAEIAEQVSLDWTIYVAQEPSGLGLGPTGLGQLFLDPKAQRFKTTHCLEDCLLSNIPTA